MESGEKQGMLSLESRAHWEKRFQSADDESLKKQYQISNDLLRYLTGEARSDELTVLEIIKKEMRKRGMKDECQN